MGRPFLISYIIPTYNRGFCISNAILSIAQQPYVFIEILVIDDGSEDNTENVVKELQKNDDRIFYYLQENQGVSRARNLGIRKAKGDIIGFLDSDDELKENILASSLDVKELIQYNATFTFFENQEIKQFVSEKNLSKQCLRMLLCGGHIHINCTLVKKDFLLEYGIEFIENLFIGEDKNFVLDILLHTDYINVIPIYTARLHHNSSNAITANFNSILQKKNYFQSRIYMVRRLMMYRRYDVLHLGVNLLWKAGKIYLFALLKRAT